MHFLAGASEGHCHKNPIVTIIIRIYPLSFYGASAVNVYPLHNDPPPAHWGSSLVCLAAIGYDGDHTWHIWEATMDMQTPTHTLSISALLLQTEKTVFGHGIVH